MRTIKNFENFVTHIDDIIYNVFIPTLFGIDIPLDNSYRNIISQSPKNGGLEIYKTYFKTQTVKIRHLN